MLSHLKAVSKVGWVGGNVVGSKVEKDNVVVSDKVVGWGNDSRILVRGAGNKSNVYLKDMLVLD
ncbi:hypothetical protein DGG96_14560 [Legionella qingyii]|uniref:Uncharacterized protein n=1 Tax=Legionella qingyii TaxID=2184757 RepID=A0A317TYZ7_9GAMM|nr:hypothetical protein DGG96_14560 [Legionella qingyii]